MFIVFDLTISLYREQRINILHNRLSRNFRTPQIKVFAILEYAQDYNISRFLKITIFIIEASE